MRRRDAPFGREQATPRSNEAATKKREISCKRYAIRLVEKLTISA
jgi:hypothetical protein